MFSLWKGVSVAFALQLVTGIVVYLWTASPKLSLVSMTAVAAMSGLAVWGFIVGDDVGQPFANLIACLIGAAFGAVFFFDASVSDWIWGEVGKWVTLSLFFCSWLIPPTLLKKEGEAASAFALYLVAAPLGAGAVIGLVIFGWEILTTGKIRVRGKYRRVFG